MNEQIAMFDYERGSREAYTLASDAYGRQAEDAWNATVCLRQSVRKLVLGDNVNAAKWFGRAVWWYERADCHLHAATDEERQWFEDNLEDGWGQYGD